MYRLHNSTELRNIFVDTPLANITCVQEHCHLRVTDYCDLTYDLPVSLSGNDTRYRKPELSMEGPVTTGWNKPGCADCGGCESHFLDCGTSNACNIPSGGFVHMEFARDVEWQTELFPTTQENTAHLLLKNQQALCFMGAGFHDMIIPNHTLEKFVMNVQWYLRLFLEETQACRHVVWITNNAPMYEEHEEYIQTVGRVKDWNQAAIQAITSDESLRTQTTIVDVFEAARYVVLTSVIHTLLVVADTA